MSRKPSWKWERGVLPEPTPEQVREIAKHAGIPLEGAKDAVAALIATDEVWMNDLYQVNMRRMPPPTEEWPAMVHLSIKRRDRSPVRDWRHLQRIKNELVGSECEGVELYPAESRLTDTANQYHIWVLAEPGQRFPFGFSSRLVWSESHGGAVQRPFEED